MTQSEKAKAWRERQGYTHKQLAELTGFSRTAIQGFERGLVKGKTVTERAMLRYKLACAGIVNKPDFDWE